jgi:Holliday junction resolvasome RuvABC endonuclease subunit
MKVLALDIATKTGWKTETASGVWDFKPNRGESSGLRLIRFKAKVREMIEMEKINVVSYERPAGQFKSSIMVASEMVGVLIALCYEMGVEVACYSAKEIKKFATDNGNANKDKMIEAAKVKYGYTGSSDDEADAIHLYYLTIKDLGK